MGVLWEKHTSSSKEALESSTAKPLDPSDKVTTLEYNESDRSSSEDVHPADPRDWSRWRKHLVFLALMSSSLLADGGMTYGATILAPQAVEWNITIAHAATSMSYGLLMQGIGGVIAVPLMDAYGRLPVWLWSQVITMGFVIGCCLAPSFATFTAFRTLQGLFGTVPQVVGLPLIHDMYSLEEWPQMINIWGTTFLVGPFVGPGLAAFLVVGTTWRGAFAVLAGLYGFSTLMIVLLGRETYYNRPLRFQQTNRLKALLGWDNIRLPKQETLVASSKNLFKLTFTPPILLIGIYMMVNFTWPIGISVTLDAFIRAPPYSFSNIASASLRFGGIPGALLGFCFGYAFNRWIRNSRTFQQDWRPEYRLHGIWIPVLVMVSGLLTYGLTLNFQKSWIGLVFGWNMSSFGAVATVVALTAFALEKYPEHSSVVSAIINMWRTCGGFSVGYFQPAWIARNGVGVVFGIQATVLAVCTVLLITPVMLLGKREAHIKRFA